MNSGGQCAARWALGLQLLDCLNQSALHCLSLEADLDMLERPILTCPMYVYMYVLHYSLCVSNNW